MNIKVLCSRFMHILVISLLIIMITSCARQGVISASSDIDNSQENETNYIKNDINTSNHKLEDNSSEQIDEVDITLEGGTGKTTILSPATVEYKDNNAYVKIVWSSKNYDYMLVGDEKYLNENEGGNSTFTIPVSDFDNPLNIKADTVAMSTPHEIDYVLYFDTKEVAKELMDYSIDNTVVESIDIGIEGERQNLLYANQFEIIKYGEYALLVIRNDASYLVVPEGKEVPSNLPSKVVVLKQPLDKTYLVSSSVMDLIRECGSIDNIVLSGTKESDWCIDEAANAMSEGSMIYAGKYSSPDYEIILGSGCNLAIENTMIYHKPEVKDKLTELGIPVLVERSSYEEHPLGRLEWIKVYGLLYGKEEVADSFFSAQVKKAESIMGEKKDVSVAFFYITTGGMINARLSTDYIAKMIELSGGSYCLKNDMESTSNIATLNMQMEDFYLQAKDADVLIYNSTIGGELESIDDLLTKNSLFKDFKAVKEGQVFCTSKNFFQQTTGSVEFMNDLCRVYKGEEDYTYLVRLN